VYNAVIIAVARDGEQIKQKIGDIVLQAGDTLMLEASPEFANVHGQTRDFYLVSRLDHTQPPRHDQALLALFFLVVMLALTAGGYMSMLNAALLAGGAMLLTGCVTITSARNGIDWPILIAVAASFGLGAALQSSGVAGAIASSLLSVSSGDPWTTLVIIFVVTVVVTELITNNAAAVLIFPIAMSAALELGVSTTPFIVTVMIGASTGFATPIGYQTHLMVFSPGGYRFSDYVKLGVPLDILIGIVTVLIVPVVWPFV
jgi:di/tricarboxylate transporter